MAYDLSDTLVVGISSTALFDLSESDKVFKDALANGTQEEAITKYREYMLKREADDLLPGTGYYIVDALLSLNKHKKEEDKLPLVEIVVMSRNSPETGIRILHNIREKGLEITRSAFTGGETVTDYLDAYDVDLFLTTSSEDAQKVTDSETCAVAIVKKPPETQVKIPQGQVRMAFDGDAVLFDEESEVTYKKEGMKSFHSKEDEKQDEPMKEGPYATLLKKLARLQDRLPHQVEYSPIRLAIVTARNRPAEMRVIKTLRSWNIYVDEIFFLGGLEKSDILRAFKAHIFFDDQEQCLTETSKHIPAGKVPYKTNSPLNKMPKAASDDKDNPNNRIRGLFKRIFQTSDD